MREVKCSEVESIIMSKVHTEQQRIRALHVVSCALCCVVRDEPYGAYTVVLCVHDTVRNGHTSLKDRTSGERSS